MALVRRYRARLVLAVAVAIALGGGWLWLRDSSLVAVRHVQIVGLSGDTAPAIRSALEQAATGMTTLDTNAGRLRAAIAPFTVVKDLRVTTQFPHGMRIEVVERLPVAALSVNGQRLPVAGNGTVVSGMPAPASVPTLPISTMPAGRRVTDRTTLLELAVLDAAPRLLRAHVAQIGYAERGLTVTLRNGPRLIFGDTTLLHAKWDAAATVLAQPGAHGATYIDVRIPSEPTAQVADPATTGAAAQAPGAVPAGPGAVTGGAAISTPGLSQSGAGSAASSGPSNTYPSGGSAPATGG
jgi:cell division protein FtsQ